MSRRIRFLPIVLLLACGCGRSNPVAPEVKPEDAGRVLALALDLEAAQKTKQAMAAYRQVVQYFPGTPEAKKAAERITQVQRAATQKRPARGKK